MHGFRLDVETHVITAAVTSIQNLMKCVRRAGIEIDGLVLEPLASAEAVLTEHEKQQGVLLADIGGGTTDIAVFKNGSIFHTSILPVAGYQVTRDIAIGLGLPFHLAEEMKKKYGDVMPSHQVQAGDRVLTEDGHSISYNDLSEVIRTRVDELLRLVVMELPHADYASIIPAGLVLTGGTANLRGITELTHEITHLPVRVGIPADLLGVSEYLRDPAYATSVGLLLWTMKNQIKQHRGSLRGLVSRILRLFR